MVQNKGKSYSSLGHELFMLPHGTTCVNADIVIEQPSRLLSIHISRGHITIVSLEVKRRNEVSL